MGEIDNGFRETRRERFYEHWCKWKVSAQMADRGIVEERMSGRGPSLGVIYVTEEPIRWINIQLDKVTDFSLRAHSIDELWNPNFEYIDYTEYGIPDARLTPHSADGFLPELQIQLTAYGAFLPSVEPAVDLHWKGKDIGLGIIGQLKNDISLESLLMEAPDMRICADDYHSCWIISTNTGDIPSRKFWDGYQAIAGHLLSAPL